MSRTSNSIRTPNPPVSRTCQRPLPPTPHKKITVPAYARANCRKSHRDRRIAHEYDQKIVRKNRNSSLSHVLDTANENEPAAGDGKNSPCSCPPPPVYSSRYPFPRRSFYNTRLPFPRRNRKRRRRKTEKNRSSRLQSLSVRRRTTANAVSQVCSCCCSASPRRRARKTEKRGAAYGPHTTRKERPPRTCFSKRPTHSSLKTVRCSCQILPRRK